MIGGTSLQKCVEDLGADGADILIGTPGRTIDLLSRHKLVSLRNMEVGYSSMKIVFSTLLI